MMFADVARIACALKTLMKTSGHDTNFVFLIIMSQFLLRRLILLLPVLFGITFVTFALARILPGDPCYRVLGERATTEAMQCLSRTGRVE